MGSFTSVAVGMMANGLCIRDCEFVSRRCGSNSIRAKGNKQWRNWIVSKAKLSPTGAVKPCRGERMLRLAASMRSVVLLIQVDFWHWLCRCWEQYWELWQKVIVAAYVNVFQWQRRSVCSSTSSSESSTALLYVILGFIQHYVRAGVCGASSMQGRSRPFGLSARRLRRVGRSGMVISSPVYRASRRNGLSRCIEKPHEWGLEHVSVGNFATRRKRRA